VSTDVFFRFQQPLPSTQAHRYFQATAKKGWKQKVNNLSEVSGLEFFCCYSLPHPNNQVNWSTRKLSCFQVLGCARELVHFKWFFQQLLSRCLRDSSL